MPIQSSIYQSPNTEPADASPNRLALPDGPASRGWWPWQQLPNLYRMKTDPVGFLSNLGEKFGDISTFLMWTQRGYLINNPRLIKDMLTTEHQDYEKALWQMGPLRRVVGDGLLTSDGELWQRQRRLIQKAFRLGTLPNYAEVTVDIANQYIERWGDGGKLNLVDEMATLTMSTSIRSNLGITPGPKADQLAQAMLQVADNLRVEMESIFPLPEIFNRQYHRDYSKNLRLVHGYIEQAIADRTIQRENGDGESFNVLYKLLDAVDEEGDGSGMAAKLARDEALTMMIAGNHSVSATLSWTWTMLLNHDKVREKVEREVLSVVGTDRKPHIDDLQQLTYTTQVIQETLRLFPSAWILFCRQAIRDTSVGKYKIKRGSWLFVVPFVTHRDERFFPDPMKFDPERFSEERIHEIPQHAYFPFGTGPHVCVGKHLAMTQLPLIMATIIQQYHVEPDHERPQLKITRDLAIRPEKGCWAKVTRRDKASIPKHHLEVSRETIR